MGFEAPVDTDPSECGNTWFGELTKLYDFIEKAIDILNKGHLCPEDSGLVRRLAERMELEKQSPSGESYREARFPSAIYQDIESTLLLRSLLRNYSSGELQNLSRLIEIELDGLSGDLKPRAMLSTTLPAAIIVGLGLIGAWSALWAGYWGFDVAGIFNEVFVERLRASEWLGWLAPLVFVIGGFVGILWYVTASHQNMKQVSRLQTLNRAIGLYRALESNIG